MDASDASVLVAIGKVVLRLQQTYPEMTHSSLRFLQRNRLYTG